MNSDMSGDFSNADWNLYARCYDALLQLRPYQKLLSIVVHALDPQQGDQILDAGCGTGNLLLRLTTLQKKMWLSGVDLSLEMLAAAKRKCAGSQVSLTRASLNERLPYCNNSFTKVSSINVLYAVKDPEFTLHELWRVSKPKSKLVLVTPRKEYDNGLILKSHALSSKPDEYWKNLHASQEREEKLVREATSDAEVAEMMLLVARYNRFISKTASFHFLTEAEFQTLVEKAGFIVTTMQGAYADQCMMVVATRGD